MLRFRRKLATLAPLVVMALLGLSGGVWAVRTSSSTNRSESTQARQLPRNSPEVDDESSTQPELSAEAPDPLVSSPEDPSIEHEPAPSTLALANAIAQGDLLLRSGNTTAAIRQYQRCGEHSEEPVRSAILYRLGLCAEALGDEDEALNRFQTVAERDADGHLREWALLGESRILSHGEHAEPALRVLQRWVLSGESTRRLSPRVAGNALALLSDLASRIALGQKQSQLWEPGAICLSRQEFDPGTHLPDSQVFPEDTTEMPPVGIHVAHQLAAATPETVTLSGRLARVKIPRAIDDIARQTHWKTEWSQIAQNIVSTHTTSIELEEQTASLTLDWLLIPFGLAWDFENLTLRIVAEQELTSDEQQQFRWQVAERALLMFLLADPEHSSTPAAYLLLGDLSFQQRHFSIARRHFEHILQTQPRSPLQAEAWFNLAQVSLAEGDLERTEQAFHGAIDAGHGQPLESAALLLAGWTTLDLDRPREAARTLMRSVALATSDDARALSLLALAAAHLLDEHPDRANIALMQGRDFLRTSALHDRAAFLASLSRFRAASTSARRARDGRELVSSLSHLVTHHELRLPEILLIADAYHDVGLAPLAIPLIEQATAKATPSPLRDRLLLKLVESLRQSGNDGQAESILVEIIDRSTGDTNVTARLQLARLYSDQHRPEMVERVCLEILGSHTADDEAHEEDFAMTLGLLGSVYASRGDRERAVLCYSGRKPPLTPSITPSPTSTDQ